jgi:steroid 5-alpha reductase family enzyme
MELIAFSKKQTLWVFVIIYLFAIFIGSLIVLYGVKNNHDIILTTLVSTVAMTIIIFFFSNILKNASIYDPYWSVIPIVIVIEWILIYKNLSLNVILMLVAVLVWGIRLTLNWWKNWSGFKHQDWRYTQLHDQAPKVYFLTNFFGIHMIPTLVVYIQLINAHDIMLYQGISPIFVIGFILSLSAAIIQFIADKQMYEFRLIHQNAKSCIDEGLWKYSRHPNYLGELTFWVGIYIMYFSHARVINLNIVYPILMISLFLFISIPLMEKKLANRPGYDEYKQNVSMLLPFRKKSSK